MSEDGDETPPQGKSRRPTESHDWGRHKGGKRWVQCQRCGVLLDQPAANEPCPRAKCPRCGGPSTGYRHYPNGYGEATVPVARYYCAPCDTEWWAEQ